MYMILVHRAQGRAATQIRLNDPILLDLRFAPKSPTLRALHKIGQINPQSLSAHPTNAIIRLTQGKTGSKSQMLLQKF